MCSSDNRKTLANVEDVDKYSTFNSFQLQIQMLFRTMAICIRSYMSDIMEYKNIEFRQDESFTYYMIRVQSPSLSWRIIVILLVK